jgi:hypothetical protein
VTSRRCTRRSRESRQRLSRRTDVAARQLTRALEVLPRKIWEIGKRPRQTTRGIRAHLACLLPVACYTGDSFKPALRRPVEQVISWDRWGRPHESR